MGYQCTTTLTCLAVGFGGALNVQIKPIAQPKLEKGERFLVSLALAGFAAVAAFLIIYLIARQPWHGG
jgi:hypothetical protein